MGRFVGRDLAGLVGGTNTYFTLPTRWRGLTHWDCGNG
nr:hypothetical protein [Burkholderia plantarii]